MKGDYKLGPPRGLRRGLTQGIERNYTEGFTKGFTEGFTEGFTKRFIKTLCKGFHYDKGIINQVHLAVHQGEPNRDLERDSHGGRTTKEDHKAVH